MDNGTHNLACPHMALTSCARGSKTSLAEIQKAAWNEDYLVKLLRLFEMQYLASLMRQPLGTTAR